MKFDFEDQGRAKQLSRLLYHQAPEETVRLVHVCGTHEITITSNGLRSIIPETIEVLEGPGCPVCVTPSSELDAAVDLAQQGKIIAAFGDMMRVPGSRISLAEARSQGADVRMVYSVSEAVNIAENEDSQVVFLGVGFETTAPMNAAALLDNPPSNFSILPANKLIPPAMETLMELPGSKVDGFIAPGHVSTIIGVEPYQSIVDEYQIPTVVAGFEPLDMLYALVLLVQQIANDEARVENAYPRAVDREGNLHSQRLLQQVFQVGQTNWRGIGSIKSSGLAVKDRYQKWDARSRFNIPKGTGIEMKSGCRCAEVLTARVTPDECSLFGNKCTPNDPYGPCMVGEEAMCNIWYRYGGRPSL